MPPQPPQGNSAGGFELTLPDPDEAIADELAAQLGLVRVRGPPTPTRALA